MPPKKRFATIDEYIRTFPKDVQSLLQGIRRTIRKVAPEAVETISYQMPTFKLDGRFLVSFAAWKHHVGMYPIPAGTDAFQKKMSEYKAAKSTVQFPLDKPVPHDLVTQLVTFRVKEVLRSGQALLVLLLSTALACGGDSAAAPATQAPTPIPSPAGWTLVFGDEFDTAGSLDPARWGNELGYIRNSEKQYYTSRSENVRSEGGNLVIEGRKEAYQGYGYTSASINTLGRFEFTYGRVEVRAKLPAGTGAWPAVWMLGTNRAQVGWPTCGEIDVMENVGFDPLRIHGSVHTAAYNHTIGTQKTGTVTIADPSQDFHVYAMEWFTDHIDVFVDGQKYFTFRNENTGARTWPFDKPQYLLINLAVGGSWGGQKGIDDTRFPQRYLVDYVRVYQQK